MKSLYDEELSYTKDAQDIDFEVGKALEPIFEKYLKKGYAVREIAHCIMGSVHISELRYVLTHKLKEKK